MTDSELRGIVLRRFYDRRHDGFVTLAETDFSGQFSFVELRSICRQLSEKGLIGEWHPTSTGAGPTIGIGRITADGIDVIEGTRSPPISITFDQRSTISVSASQNVQIGNQNVQSIAIHLQSLAKAIEHSSATEQEKSEAKSLLNKFLAHPLVSALLGGVISSL